MNNSSKLLQFSASLIWLQCIFVLTGDLLENYCHDDDLMNVSRFVFALSIMLTYPIECFVTREVRTFIFINKSTLYKLAKIIRIDSESNFQCYIQNLATVNTRNLPLFILFWPRSPSLSMSLQKTGRIQMAQSISLKTQL